MPNFTKALLVFSSWAIIALISHFLLSKYQSGFCSHIEHKKSSSKVVNSGTQYYFITGLNDTISRYQTQQNIFKNQQFSQQNIDSITFINDLINKLQNNYRLRLEVSTNSNKNEANFISAIESKFKNASIDTELLKFETLENLNENIINFNLLEKNKQLIDSIELSITSKTLHLEFENNEVKESEELISYSKLLRQYLQYYNDKSISITGHTNNNGYFENNLIKGFQMANSLKNYFINTQKIIAEINTYSRGEAEPIANKYTEEGKLLNQRIEVKIN
jgi:outer membrane protein OmpA-like peptidoglycan-associated protein